MEELWGFVEWGVGCWLLLMVAIGGFLLGSRSGRLQERSNNARNRLRQNKVRLSKHKLQLAEYRAMVEKLEQDLATQSTQSEDYNRLQQEWLAYQEKIGRLEGEIELLSSGAVSMGEAAPPTVDIISLICALREDPTHANPSRAEWDALMQQSDAVFNHFLTDLTNRYKITRHEQEICCLIKWGFSRREQLAAFNNTSDALTKSKGRLKKRLGLDEHTDLDNYIRLL